MITSIEEISSIEDVIEYFENKGTPLTEEEKAMFHSDFFLKKNSDKKLVKICEANKCYDGVWCEGKDYCEVHQSEQEKLQSLVQQKFPSLSNPQEVIRFETWWNKNLGTVITGIYPCYPCTIWLIVYEPEQRSMNERLEKIEINNGYDKNSLDSAKSKASSLRNELNGENPILAIHPQINSYVSFDSLITSPYVLKKEVPSEMKLDYSLSMFLPSLFPKLKHIYPSNPSNYLKPLDIIKVKCTDRIIPGINLTGLEYYYHAGVYLGKIDGEFKVCHFSKEEKGTRIQSWEKFLEGAAGELIRYHPIIPLKHYSKIAYQVVWAKEKGFWENNYNLCNRNCEHLANMLVYGINYSEQIEEKKIAIRAVQWGTAPYSFGFVLPNQTFNNDKGSTIKLTSELAETERKFDYTNAYHHQAEQIQAQYLQEVPPKENCRIM